MSKPLPIEYRLNELTESIDKFSLRLLSLYDGIVTSNPRLTFKSKSTSLPTERRYKRLNLPCLSAYIFPDTFHRSNMLGLARPERIFTQMDDPCTYFPSYVFTAHLELEAENKTQECRIFYVFIIRSVQLKSLGQTNLLVRRREFTPSLLQSINCSNFVRQTRRKKIDWSDNKPFTVNIPRTNILVCTYNKYVYMSRHIPPSQAG